MKVLLAQKNLPLENSIKRELSRRGWDYETCEDGKEVYRVLTSKNNPCIALIEDELPGMNGREICERVRKKGRRIGCYIYIILVGKKDDIQSKIEGLKAGADDYVPQNVQVDELMARILAGQRLCEFTQDLISENEKIKLLSRLDPLTGAFTRAATMEELDIAMYRARREKIPLSVILFDVAGMHDINEEYGSRAGDRILQEVARIIAGNIRKTDVLGRVGGDDFLVVIPGANQNKAEKIAGRLHGELDGLQIDVNERAVPIAIRRAIASWDGTKTAEEFITHIYDKLK